MASAFSFVFIANILPVFSHHCVLGVLLYVLGCANFFSLHVFRFAVHVLATDIIRESEGANACGDALEVVI